MQPVKLKKTPAQRKHTRSVNSPWARGGAKKIARTEQWRKSQYPIQFVLLEHFLKEHNVTLESMHAYLVEHFDSEAHIESQEDDWPEWEMASAVVPPSNSVPGLAEVNGRRSSLRMSSTIPPKAIPLSLGRQHYRIASTWDDPDVPVLEADADYGTPFTSAHPLKDFFAFGPTLPPDEAASTIHNMRDPDYFRPEHGTQGGYRWALGQGPGSAGALVRQRFKSDGQ